MASWDVSDYLSVSGENYVVLRRSAKQFPGLEGRTTEERIKYSRSRWPRQEVNPEEALWLGGTVIVD